MYIPYGLVVRIPGFHPGGPGSIPGVGTLFYPLVQALCKHEPLPNHLSHWAYVCNDNKI